jgi:galactofuranose transport system permease protein
MGWIIDTLKLPAFIITLAGMFFVRGMSFIVSEESIPIDHPLYDDAGELCLETAGRWDAFTLLALVMLLVVFVGMVLAHRTRFGHNVYAIGGGNRVGGADGRSGTAYHRADLHALEHAGRHCPGSFSRSTPRQVTRWQPAA